MNSFPGLDSQIADGPTWVHEYSTREAYGANITWSVNDPLNATWWHLVTEGSLIINHAHFLYLVYDVNAGLELQRWKRTRVSSR